jgi:hypothetical protein
MSAETDGTSVMIVDRLAIIFAATGRPLGGSPAAGLVASAPFCWTSAPAITSAHECRNIQQGADMTQRIPENFSPAKWRLITIMDNTMPPRDPNDDDEEDEDEDNDTKPDNEREPPAVTEPDEDE